MPILVDYLDKTLALLSGNTGEGKTIPVTGPEGSMRLSLPYFETIGI
jgi:hypothetical protein